MKKLATLVSALLLSFAAQALEVAGVKLPGKIQLEQQSLTLNGAGIRKMLFMDLYVGSLYAQSKATQAADVLESKDPVAIRLNIISGMITSDRMASTVKEGFDKATGGNMQPLQKRLDSFIDVFSEEIVKGDQFTLLAVPGKGLNVYKNGTFLTHIKGDDFSKTLLKVWLGDKPADKRLKKAMLGS
ncbi:MAG: chalcone isomerase family protein [Endozoicomonas sp.]